MIDKECLDCKRYYSKSCNELKIEEEIRLQLKIVVLDI